MKTLYDVWSRIQYDRKIDKNIKYSVSNDDLLIVLDEDKKRYDRNIIIEIDNETLMEWMPKLSEDQLKEVITDFMNNDESYEIIKPHIVKHARTMYEDEF